MRTLAAAAALAVSGAAMLAVALLHRVDSSLPQVSAVRVDAVLAGGDHRFGDVVPGRLDVLVPASVDPGSVRVHATFAPYRLVAPMRLERWRDRGTAILRYRFELECLDTGCAPREDRAGFLFPPVRVDFRTRAGRPGRRQAEWPTIAVVPRPKPPLFSPWETGLRPLPAPSYRVPPRLAAVFALALALASLALAGWLVRPLLRRAGGTSPEPALLERALRAVRRAARLDDVDERRRALDLLAVALRGGATREREAARRLAWSRPSPPAAAMDELADRVERA